MRNNFHLLEKEKFADFLKNMRRYEITTRTSLNSFRILKRELETRAAIIYGLQ